MKAIIKFFIVYLFLPIQFIYSQWIIQHSDTSEFYFSTHFSNQNTGWLSGFDLNIGGIIKKTTNGGNNWFNQLSWTYIDFGSIYFINQNTGWYAGGNALIKTTNGGTNWVEQNQMMNIFFNSVYFVDQNIGWSVGHVQISSQHWSGIIIKTTNGGTNWFTQYNTDSSSNNLLSVFFINQNNGWTVGLNGLILHTTNGGINWVDQFWWNPFSLKSVYFIDQYTGWAVGHSGFTIKTTNGGINWNNQYVDNVILQSVYFINQNTGWVAGYCSPSCGTILKTTDGGENWTTQYIGNNRLESINFTDENNGWAVGWNGLILHTSNGGEPVGIKPISKEIPKKFTLNQNYPNPFNPSTNIEFALPKTTLAKLIIYDITGKEIETLINEELKAGIYKVDFSATVGGNNLSSGVYFYRLSARGGTNEFTETKKMILLK
jgi:photosystem II stability/assembly factor-like uncharacterized protein